MKLSLFIIVLLFSAVQAIAGTNCPNLCNKDWWENNDLISLKNELQVNNNSINLDPDGYSMVYYAAAHGSAEMLEFLLTKVPTTTPPDSDGFTLLHAAVEFGSIENIKVLLDHGIDPNAQTLFGYTALHTAASDRGDKVVLLLIDNGADPTIEDDSGRTPFDHASANKKLLEKTLLKLFKAVQE